MSLYLIVVLLCLAGPLALSFEKNLRLYKRWKYLIPGILIAMVIFGGWDIIFTHIGCWQFNPRYNSGIYFFNLPLEEYLFFICIPYACAFSYYAIEFHFPRYIVNELGTKVLTILFVAGSLAVSISNTDRTYTFINFLVLAIVVALSYFFARKVLARYYAIFPVLIIPFLIVNGILTGTGIDQEVFSYNEDVILSIRILTMPIEDLFYAFSLLLTSIMFTDIIENNYKKNKK